MALLTVGELELYHETFGDPADEPVLLIAGIGAQCLSWPVGFCEALADRFLYVIRFDNRDIGLSTKLDHLPFRFDEAMAAMLSGGSFEPPYLLDDMAADAAGVLDALGLESAHMVGMSLGGMIAQLVAINHPDRVRSLTSIMSNTGNPDFGTGSEEAIEALLSPAPATRAESIARSIAQRRVWGTPGLLDEVALAEQFGEMWDRDHHPDAAQRQYGAAMASADREPALRRLDVATLVVHGGQDTLIAPSGGERTAELIPNARLLMIDEMGHDLVDAFWAPIVEAILQLIVDRRD